jgi:hypothetical protein
MFAMSNIRTGAMKANSMADTPDVSDQRLLAFTVLAEPRGAGG